MDGQNLLMIFGCLHWNHGLSCSFSDCPGRPSKQFATLRHSCSQIILPPVWSNLDLSGVCQILHVAPSKLSHHLWTVLAAASPAQAKWCHCDCNSKRGSPALRPGFPTFLKAHARAHIQTQHLANTFVHAYYIVYLHNIHTSYIVYRISYILNMYGCMMYV